MSFNLESTLFEENVHSSVEARDENLYTPHRVRTKLFPPAGLLVSRGSWQKRTPTRLQFTLVAGTIDGASCGEGFFFDTRDFMEFTKLDIQQMWFLSQFAVIGAITSTKPIY